MNKATYACKSYLTRVHKHYSDKRRHEAGDVPDRSGRFAFGEILGGALGFFFQDLFDAFVVRVISHDPRPRLTVLAVKKADFSTTLCPNNDIDAFIYPVLMVLIHCRADPTGSL